MGLFNKVIKDERKDLTPESAFQTALEASKLFPMNDLNEFNDADTFDIKARNFTALLICSAFIYIKKVYQDNIIQPDPFNDKFFGPLIRLISENGVEKGLLNVYGMDRCLEMLERISVELIKIADSGNMSYDLAFNYYEYSGQLDFIETAYLDDKNNTFHDVEKINELHEVIKTVGKNILLKIS